MAGSGFSGNNYCYPVIMVAWDGLELTVLSQAAESTMLQASV